MSSASQLRLNTIDVLYLASRRLLMYVLLSRPSVLVSLLTSHVPTCLTLICNCKLIRLLRIATGFSAIVAGGALRRNTVNVGCRAPNAKNANEKSPLLSHAHAAKITPPGASAVLSRGSFNFNVRTALETSQQLPIS